MNILMVNQPLNNRGDESAHKALIRNLSSMYPQIAITVLFPESKREDIKSFCVAANNVSYKLYHSKWKYCAFKMVGMYFPLLRLLWYIHPTIKELINYYKQADIVLGAPGGISMGGFQNWDHLFLLHLAKFVKKPLVYYGRSFGPFPTMTWKNRIYKKESYEILRYFSYLSIRDKKTETLADEIGLHYLSTVDTAFLDTIRCDIPQGIADKIDGKYMVFVPNLLIWHYNYKNRITKKQVLSFFIKLIRIVMEKFPNYQILMLPQTYGYKEEFKNDVNFFYELAGNIKSPKIVVIPDTFSSDDQQAVIQRAEFVVGARYHSVVFAINNNVPFISLSYEHKMSGLLATLGREDRMVDINNAMNNPESEKQTLAMFKEKLQFLESDIETTQKAKNIALRGFQSFCKSIKGL